MFWKGSMPARPRRSPSAGASLLLAFSLLVIPGVAACSADHSQGDGTASAPTAAVGVSGSHMMPNGMQMTTAEMDAAWTSRPAFARADQRTEAAYAYAFRNWNVIGWMPCYCGCAAMGHESNLDCYFKRSAKGSTKVSWEEHASYCQVCVDISLTAQKLQGQGSSLSQIRAAVDRQFGSAGPGTTTALPPS